jgi:dolichol-phosphate mannosyltransferase
MKGGGVSDLPLYRRILSGGGTFLSNLVLGTKLKDMTSGYEAFQRKVLENINLDQIMSTGHMYQTEMRFYCRNLNTIEVPIHYVGSSTGLKASTVMEALSILFKLKDHEKYIWKNII